MDNTNHSNTNSFFEEDWWLDIVANGEWERIELRDKNNHIFASFPIVKERKIGFKYLTVPKHTQSLGIYIEDTGAKLSKKLEREKKIINDIIKSLPKGYNYDFRLDSNNQYIMPFIWNGFNVSPCFSYRIDTAKGESDIWKGLKDNIKTDIKKAMRTVNIVDDYSIDILIDLEKKTFDRQNRSYKQDLSFYHQIDKYLSSQGRKNLLCAVDNNGNVHSAAYFVFDRERCYYLLGGGDPDFRNSGAASLLIWEGIKEATRKGVLFDFEGSMIEGIERFFRGFGAHPSVYYRVRKTNALLATAEYYKPKIKKILHYV